MSKDLVSIRVKIDRETKEIAANILKDMGLNMTIVVRMLLKKVARDKRIPFDLSLSEKQEIVDNRRYR